MTIAYWTPRVTGTGGAIVTETNVPTTDGILAWGMLAEPRAAPVGRPPLAARISSLSGSDGRKSLSLLIITSTWSRFPLIPAVNDCAVGSAGKTHRNPPRVGDWSSVPA